LREKYSQCFNPKNWSNRGLFNSSFSSQRIYTFPYFGYVPFSLICEMGSSH
jgi:hypothetical protein